MGTPGWAQPDRWSTVGVDTDRQQVRLICGVVRSARVQRFRPSPVINRYVNDSPSRVPPLRVRAANSSDFVLF